MTPLMIFKITTLMCFIFSLKIKMYQKNIVGFVTVVTVFVSILASYVIEDFENIHYLLISLLMIFIVAYNTYKKYKRSLYV